MLKSVIMWESGMVMVFDTRGKQVPDLQGHISDVLDAVLYATEGEGGRGVAFELGKWKQGTTPCNREAFIQAAKNTPALEK